MIFFSNQYSSVNFRLKIMLICFFLMPSFNLFSQVHVSISTTTTSSYCNGTPKEEEYYNEISTPKPITATLFIYPAKQRDSSIAFIVKSNDTISLTPGKYIITFSEKLTKEQIEILVQPEKNPDIAGVKSLYLNKHIISVTKKKNQLFTINYHKYCPWEIDPENSPVPNSNRH